MSAILKAAMLAALLLAGPATAHADDARARTVLAAAKAASGGAAWDRLQGSYEKGAHGGAPYETWLDFRSYGMRVENARGVQGFNGVVSWRRGSDGKVVETREAGALKEAVTTAFVSNNGFFFPDRFPARATSLASAGASAGFDVVEVEPQGGRAFELWFDRKTHLLSRIVDRQGPQPVTVSLSDYRRLGEVLVAFRGTVTGPDGAVLDEGRVDAAEHRPVPRATFDPPGS